MKVCSKCLGKNIIIQIRLVCGRVCGEQPFFEVNQLHKFSEMFSLITIFVVERKSFMNKLCQKLFKNRIKKCCSYWYLNTKLYFLAPLEICCPCLKSIIVVYLFCEKKKKMDRGYKLNSTAFLDKQMKLSWLPLGTVLKTYKRCHLWI